MVYIQDNFIIIKNMVKVNLKHLIIHHIMMVIGFKVENMVKDIKKLMIIFMKEIFNQEINQEHVNIKCNLEHMKDKLLMDKLQVKED